MAPCKATASETSAPAQAVAMSDTIKEIPPTVTKLQPSTAESILKTTPYWLISEAELGVSLPELSMRILACLISVKPLCLPVNERIRRLYIETIYQMGLKGRIQGRVPLQIDR